MVHFDAPTWLTGEASTPGKKHAKAAQTGREGQRRGLGFEDALDGLHAAYNAAGRAWVIKVPAPYRVLGKPTGSRFTAAWEGEGPPDYAGAVGGRPICFDAKQTAGDRWSFDALAPHQAQHFDRAAAQGVACFVLLWLDGNVWLVPWATLGPRWWAWRERRALREAVPYGSASLSTAGLHDVGHRCQGYDWLPVFSRLWGAP
jgi:recombination protein U